MFTRLNETIINAIQKVIDASVYDFSRWWQDDFPTEYGYDTEEELRGFNENEINAVKYDWIYWVIDGFVYAACDELGIRTDTGETDSHDIIIQEIYDIVKDKLFEKIELEWK